MKPTFFLIFLTLCSILLAAGETASVAAREELTLDEGWRFLLVDAAAPDEPATPEQPGFDDATWRGVDLPHDWAFEADYREDAAQTDRGGYKPGGLGWYRKSFELPEGWTGQRVIIDFDAVYMNSEVWINGVFLGKRPYGYISFQYDLTEHLRPGKNTLAVRVDCRLEPSARWYHGCGIYGHVKLVATSPVHVAHDGVFVRTPKVSDDRAEVAVDTEVVNAGDGSVRATLETFMLDPEGRQVAVASEEIDLPAGETRTFGQTLTVPDPMRWELDAPHLYHAGTRLLVDGEAVDEGQTRFGVRTIRWETGTGFWLNEKNVKLLGVCEHLEGGPVGAASPDGLIRWKIQLLKDMGCNAIRVAHNPQVPAFYDLCDEMGMLVMDEIFDGWKAKAAEDYGKQAFDEWWERDLRAWLRRDRNHPCVIIWSLGNETSGEIGEDLVRVCHEFDPTRLTTSGHSGSEFMDVLGVNGHSEKRHFYDDPPGQPFVATEAPHTWQTRGYYRSKTWFRDGYPSDRQDPFPCPDLTETEIFTYDWTAPEHRTNRKQILNSSYDNAMVRITARKNWELLRDLPWYGGHFRWTGFDYLGEAGYVHGGWPFRFFMGGALDPAGFKKDLYYFYQSQWTEEPMAHLLPHWTHPKMKPGTKIPVWVYSNGDEVELFLNGESLGKDEPGTKWDEMQCEWMVPWTPGKLEAVAYRDGQEVARATQVTAGAPEALKVSVSGEKNPIVTVAQVDAEGVMNPYAENRIHYHIDGPARILSLESGNPVNTENNTGNTSRAAWFGLGRAFLQATADEGEIAVVAGAICGEKQLMSSDLIRIDVRSVPVRGAAPGGDFEVRYSTDGSEPSLDYTGAFAVAPDTVIKADVFRGGARLFRMSERFGPGEGIHWGTGTPSSGIKPGGEQAEDAKFDGPVVSTKGKGFHGRGYLDFQGRPGAWVEWYQENDGSAGVFELAIRYRGKVAGKKGSPMKLTVNDEVIEPNIFLPNSKGEGTEWKTRRVEVKLERGANTIRLTTVKDGGMSIDEVTLR